MTSYHTDHPEPLLLHDPVVSAIAVYTDDRHKLPPAGTAYPKGWVWAGAVKARVFEVQIKGRERPEDGLYLVRRGRFERLGDAAEVMR